MKKIFIATSCALLLCLTSCATKQAPQDDSQTIAPETSVEDTEAEEAAVESDTQENTQNSEEEAVEVPASEEAENNPLVSEAFPEPEEITEPEIITLEPVEEPEPFEKTPDAEEVEKEEPPEITLVTEDDITEAENQAVEENTENENSESENSDSEDNIDITANDIIIASDSSDSDGISGGIDITDETSDSDVSLSELEKDITPSRSVTLKKFEYLDVTYPGSGWIYMGLTDNSKDLAYFGRKLGTKDTKFSLQARAAGRKIIHFYRNDPLTGQYLDDYIEVIVSSENGSNKTHIEAPEYKLPVQKKEGSKKAEQTEEETKDTADENKEASQDEKSSSSSATQSAQTNKESQSSQNAQTAQTATTGTTQKAQSSTASEETQSTKSSDTNTTAADTSVSTNQNTGNNITPDTLLKEAQLLYNEKEYKAALTKLNNFFELSTDNRDEALYLQGQILEAKSDVRDIKGAIDAYTTLTKNYPASKYWDDANKRIIYLKRFYLEVR